MRIADVIQVNMQQVGTQPADSSEKFSMEKAVVYYQIQCDIEVSPLLLSWSLLAGEEGNPYQETSWRSFKYEAIQGY